MAGHRSTRVARSVVPAVLAALVLLLIGRRGAAIAVASVAVVLLIVGLAAPRAAAAIDAAIGRAAHAVGRALNAVLGVAAWVLLVLPVWGTSRLARLDLLDRPAGATGAWSPTIPSARTRPASERLGAAAEVRPHRPFVRRAFRFALLLALPLVLLYGAISARQADPPDAFTYSPIGHESEPFARELFAELALITGRWDPILGSVPYEQKGRYVNVVDGHRVTYQPADPELTVWFFGGSTIYGIGQRDEHTIPSVVAKLAERDGISIEGVNFGFPGYVNWVEVQRLSQELSAGARPDLVVFYDGVNELGLATQRADRGDTDPRVTSRELISEYERTMWQKNREDARPRELSIEEKAQLAGQQYGRGVDVARILGKAYGIPMAFFWQPTLETKRPTPADDEVLAYVGLDKERLPDIAQLIDRTIEVSGADPIDLTKSLDGISTPVFLDVGHTNELGARTVAEAMYAELRPQLVALQGDR